MLEQLAGWMPVHGEAIFGTRPWKVFGEGPNLGQEGHFNESKAKYTARDIRFTRKGDAVYAIVLGWPGAARRPHDQIALTGERHYRPESVTLLGHDAPLPFKTTPDGLRVKLPERASSPLAVAGKIL